MEASEKLVRWGILSTANIAQKWVQAAKQVPNIKVHAVASRSLPKAQGIRPQFFVSNTDGLKNGPRRMGSKKRMDPMLNCWMTQKYRLSTSRFLRHCIANIL